MSGWPVLRSACDPGGESFKGNAEVNERLAADLRERLAVAALGGPREVAGQARVTGQAAAPRPRRRPARPGLTIPGALPAGRHRPVRRRGPRGRDHHRRGPRLRPRVRGRRQRRHRQGRHVLPDHGQEAPARPGGRPPQQPAVRLPRRLRRRVPAQAGRGLPRPRALRPHLLQPGHHVGARHPADRRRPRLLYGGRRVRPGDERRGGDRPQPGHDLPRRPAAGEGGDRRGGHRRGAGRRRPARPGQRRHRPPRRRRRATR